MWAARFAGLHRGSASAEETWEQAGAGQAVKDLRARILMKVTTYVSMGLITNPPHDLVPLSE